jgi:integrase
MEVMPKSPMVKVRIPKVDSAPTKHIPLEHFQSILLHASSNPYMYARVIVGMCMGLRSGEVFGLKWSDIDWKNNRLTIERQVQRVKGQGLDFYPVKQGAVRSIPLDERWILAFEEHRHFQDIEKSSWRTDLNLIFPGPNGDFLDAKRDWHLWRELLEEAGLPMYEPRQMRKTAFTNMAQRTDLKTLMEFSRHTQVSTLMKSYVFASSESLNSAVSAVQEIFPDIEDALSETYIEGAFDDMQSDSVLGINRLEASKDV